MTATALGCPTCTRPAAHPFRSYDMRGKVLNGCVDKYHDGHLVPGTESARWHARPAAKQLRRRAAKAMVQGYQHLERTRKDWHR